MRPRPLIAAVASAVLAGAVPALAWHVAGTVYCDQNGNLAIDAADTPLAGYTAQTTSQVTSPGATLTGTTDASGAYFIAEPDVGDTYAVTLSGLPGGQTIGVPAGGSYTITLSAAQDHQDGVDFLVEGCAGMSSTTTTTTTLATTTTSTLASATTTTTTTGTTTTTTLCPPIPFLMCNGGRINDYHRVLGDVAANNPGALLRLSRGGFAADGTSIIGDHVEIGDGTSVDDVLTNDLHQGSGVTIRGAVSPAPPLPLVTPCCEIPAFSCGGGAVTVAPGNTRTLTPGTYGDLRVLNGGRLELAPGTYTFCRLKTGRQATIEPQGAVTIDVVGQVNLGAYSVLAPVASAPMAQLNVGGRLVRLTLSTVTRAMVTAPNAQIRIGRGANVQGGFCVDTAQTDKRIMLECP
jgi:hypothetical protein